MPIKRTQIYVYTWCGLLAGLAGVIYAAQNHQGNPNAGISYEFEAIAAVVIGGTSLAGGKGSMAGTVVGTLIMGILTNMLRLNNVDSNTEMMLKAVIIVAAVWIQQFDARSEQGNVIYMRDIGDHRAPRAFCCVRNPPAPGAEEILRGLQPMQ